MTTQDRQQQYKDLTDLSQDLLNLLYGSEDAFIQTTIISPFEAYILQLDQILGQRRSEAALGSRMGLRIPPDVDPDLYLPDQIEKVLTLPNQSSENDQLNADTVLQMTEDDYREIADHHGWLNNRFGYENRLAYYIDEMETDVTIH